MIENQKTNILLLPPGSFDSSFFDFYLHKYKTLLERFSIFTLDLPSRDSSVSNPLHEDGKFISNYINNSQTKWIILGMSTSAASLIEALSLIDKSKLVSICLIFAGEIIPPNRKSLSKLGLRFINTNKVLRNLFFSYLRVKFGAYKRDKRLKPQTLIKFYQSLPDWKLPIRTDNIRTLIVHAKKDNLIDISSRARLESMFPNSRVLTLECTHEPSDKVADVLLSTLQDEVDYLIGKN